VGRTTRAASHYLRSPGSGQIYLRVSLQFAFEVQTRGTFLAGATLEIQETPLIAFCHTCQHEYQPEVGIQYACPSCHSPMDDIRSGRELKIDRIEYEPIGVSH